MRIIDDTSSPEARTEKCKFEANEIGLDAFGYDIENRHLIEAHWRTRGAISPACRYVDGEVTGDHA